MRSDRILESLVTSWRKPLRAGVTDRQVQMLEDILGWVGEFGPFDPGSGADGADYEEAAENDDSDSGLQCSNCLFFVAGGQCQVVAGPIEPAGLCRFWVIPGDLITPEPDDENEAPETN